MHHLVYTIGMHRPWHRFLPILALVTAACGLLPPPATPVTRPAPTGSSTLVTPGSNPTAVTNGTPAGPGRTPVGPIGLRVWLPPEFTPDVGTRGGQLLAGQIQAFENSHPGTAVVIRTKADTGLGGLLSSLTTASNAAPSILPDVIALSRDDLASAAASGLVSPLETWIPAATLSDFYPFAKAMGRVNGVWVGLPFAADAHVLAYLSTAYATPPLHWTDVLTGPLLLPAGENTGLTVLNTYLAAGGSLADANGKLHLNPDILAQALQVFQRLQLAGTLPQSALAFANTGLTWQAFRERRASLAVTSAGLFLAEYIRVDGASATLLPSDGDTPVALADGWSWAIVNTAPERRSLSAQLINWLIAPEQSAPWTEAAAVLPTRAASLAAWKSPRLTPVASDVVAHALLQPPGAQLATLGPALQQALADVLSERATPFAAATVAASAVNQP
jgi:ABC-type glycerol-3-phosphate transport system substrate-binding protein